MDERHLGSGLKGSLSDRGPGSVFKLSSKRDARPMTASSSRSNCSSAPSCFLFEPPADVLTSLGAASGHGILANRSDKGAVSPRFPHGPHLNEPSNQENARGIQESVAPARLAYRRES